MGISLDRVLQLPAFQKAEVLAGKKYISRLVEYVDVMEVPDVDHWLRANEMLLTTAYAIKNDQKAQEKLVAKLSAAGVTALCIKPGRFIDRIPDKMIVEAEKHGLLLIKLPIHVPYIDIITQVLGEILNERTSDIEVVNQVHHALTGVVLAGGDLQAVCKKLSEFIDADITIFYQEGKIIAYANREQSDCLPPVQPKLLRKIKQNLRAEYYMKPEIVNQNGRKYIVTPVIIGRIIHGYLLLSESNHYDDQTVCRLSEQASMVVALEMLKEKNRRETKERLMRDLINDILEGNTSEEVLKERTRHFNLDLTGGMSVFVVDVSETPCSETSIDFYLDMFQMALKKIVPNALILDKEDKIISLIKPPSEILQGKKDYKVYTYMKKLAEKIYRQIDSNPEALRIMIGIGSCYDQLEEIYKSYHEALIALDISRNTMDYGKLVHYDDIGVYKILMGVAEPGYLKQFALEKLQNILDYDDDNGTQLLKTLEIYLKNGKRIDRTARDLFVHRNTARYRIKRIVDIAGVDLNDGEMTFNLQFSLKALKAYHALNKLKL